MFSQNSRMMKVNLKRVDQKDLKSTRAPYDIFIYVHETPKDCLNNWGEWLKRRIHGDVSFNTIKQALKGYHRQMISTEMFKSGQAEIMEENHRLKQLLDRSKYFVSDYAVDDSTVASELISEINEELKL